MGALGDGRVELPAQAVVEREARRHLPGVLRIGVEVVAVDGGGADVLAVGEIGRRDGDGVDERAAGEKAGERVGQRIAGVDVMRAALRGNDFGGIGGAAAEVVFAVGADAEVGGVAIEARPRTPALKAWLPVVKATFSRP